MSRDQFYTRFDHVCALMFTFVIFGITVLLTIAFALFDSVSSSDEEEDESNKEEIFDKIAALVRPQCLALEHAVRAFVTKQHPASAEAEQEAIVTKEMQSHEMHFMANAAEVAELPLQQLP